MPRPSKTAGSVALVTGANRGLGLAFVRELAARGAKAVYAGVRDPGALAAESAGLPAEVVPLGPGRPRPRRARDRHRLHGGRRAGQVRQGPGPLRARHDQAARGHGHGHGTVAVAGNRWAELRQVGFAALDHAAAVRTATELLALGPGFGDPLLAALNLADFTAPVGPGTYVEVLAPTTPDHSVARWLGRVGGSSGWVLSTQVPSLDGGEGARRRARRPDRGRDRGQASRASCATPRSALSELPDKLS